MALWRWVALHAHIISWFKYHGTILSGYTLYHDPSFHDYELEVIKWVTPLRNNIRQANNVPKDQIIGLSGDAGMRVLTRRPSPKFRGTEDRTRRLGAEYCSYSELFWRTKSILNQQL